MRRSIIIISVSLAFMATMTGCFEPHSSSRSHAGSSSLFGTLFQLPGKSVAALSSTGNTYYISPNGSNSYSGTMPDRPFATFAKAFGSMQGGDMLYLRGGTYAEGIGNGSYGMPNHIIRGGTSWATATVIASYENEAATLPYMSLSNAAYIVFDGVNFDGRGSGGVLLDSNTNHIRLQNAEIKNAYADGVSEYAGSEFNEFVNLDVHDNGWGAVASCEACGWPGVTWAMPYGGGCYYHGLYLSAGNSLVENSRIHDNTGYGLHIYHSGGTESSRDVIRNNVIYNNGRSAGDCGAYGMILASGADKIAVGNELYGNYSGAIQIGFSCTGCQVFNNSIHDEPGSGVLVDGQYGFVSGTVIRSNVIYNAQGGAIASAGSNIANTSSSGNWCDASGMGCDLMGGSPPSSLPAVANCSVGGWTYDCATVTPREWDPACSAGGCGGTPAPAPAPAPIQGSCGGGSLCDGSLVTGVTGQTVCGGDFKNWSCTNLGWEPLGTPCTCGVAPTPATECRVDVPSCPNHTNVQGYGLSDDYENSASDE